MNYIKTKIMCGVACLFLVTLLFCSGYEYFKISEFKSDIVKLNVELGTEKSSIDSYVSLAKTASSIKDESEKINTFFIKKDEIVDFLNDIEKISNVSNASISVKSLGEKELSEDQHILNVQIHIQGSYSNVYRTMQLLENLPYYTEIQSVKLSHVEIENGAKNKDNVWQSDINFNGVIL